MKQKFGKRFILIPIGLFVISGTLILSQLTNTPDLIKGISFGVGIGLTALPIFLKKLKQVSC
jgi:hypothetical protein